ncbi:MAG: polysaccharide biosynthesis protein [Prevotella sp.]|nr:polysaccharide biosynthesis protein [Prevotella sp.]
MNLLQKLTNWYFTRDALPYWCVFIFDCLMTFLSGLVVFWAYHRTGYNISHFWGILNSIVLYVLIAMVGFRLFKTYTGMMRYSSFSDLQRIAFANAFSLFIAIIVHYPMYKLPKPTFEAFHLRHLVVMYVVATMLMWAGRVLMKEIYEISRAKTSRKNVLIYGIKEGGVGLAKLIRSEQPARFNLRGFISHEKNFKGHLLMGVGVYQQEELEEVLERLHIRAVLVSPQRNYEFRNDGKLQNILTEAGVTIYMTEGFSEGTKQGQMQLKAVSIDDLLPRDEIKVDLEGVSNMLKNQKILITGSAGSIGSEMVRQIASFAPSEMMLIDQAETPQHDIRLMMRKQWPGIKVHTVVTSICKEKRMEKVFADFRPDYVFHAAAYKHVPMMEDNPSESVQNNVQGTKILADLSVKYGVKKFVMISTDKAVNPTNVMGCSKRICEIYVQSLDSELKRRGGNNVNTQFVTTRFGNVLGSNGSVIPLFERQIKEGGPVTVTHPDIIRYFMLIPEACKLVLEAGTMGKGGEIFVFDMGKPVKIADLAKRMILLSGAKNVEIKFTGLRPGEKLYEEMLSTEENTKPSFHEKIRIASVREYDYDKVLSEINELIAQSLLYDDMATVKKMKEIVPEYISNNSVYSQLDTRKS